MTLISAGVAFSLNATAAENWTWYPVATSQSSDFVQKRETALKQTESRDVAVSTSNWVVKDAAYKCTPWTPDTAGVNQGVAVTQTRSCGKIREREWEYDADGELIHNRIEWETINGQAETRTAYGSGDYIVSTDYSDWSGWGSTGFPFSCDAWTPDSSNVDDGLEFQQTRNCSEVQNRTRREVFTWYSGRNTYGTTDTETRTVNVTDSRFRTGTLIDGWIFVSTMYGPWLEYDQATGEATEECDSFNFPNDKLVSFYISRSCEQSESRTAVDLYQHVYTDKYKFKNPRSESRILDFTETKYVYVQVDPYEIVQGPYSCSSYSPAIGMQTSNFVQTRACLYDEERDRTYSIDGSNVWSTIDKRTVTYNNNRTVSVSSGSWYDVGRVGYTNWFPEAGSQILNFNQTRSYTQQQSRVWTYKEGSTILSTRIEDRGLDNTVETRGVGVDATDWSETTRVSYSSWTPAIASQTSSFTQNRTYDQNYTRTWTYKVSGVLIASREELGVSTNKSEARRVGVSVSNWSNTTKSNYTSWSPAVGSQTSNFTQTRSYTQGRARVWSYDLKGTVVSSRTETSSLTNQTESRIVTVSASPWSTTSNTNYGSWSPAPSNQTSNFTQTRSYTKNEKRTWTYVEAGVTTYRVETRATGQTQSRTVTVSVTGWSLTSYSNYGNWSPSPSNQTSSYTQSRNYTKNEKRTWSYVAGGVTTTRDETRSTGQTQTRTVDVSVSGWSTTTSTNYGSWSPAASNQTSSFTQTRSYTKNEKRTWTYVAGGVSTTRVETRASNQTQSRTVTVSYGSWSYHSNHSYGSWSPSASTVCSTATFTQSRSYKRKEKRTRTYKSGTTTVGSATEYQDLNKTQTRSTQGTKSCEVVCRFDSNNKIVEDEMEVNDYGERENEFDRVSWKWDGVVIYHWEENSDGIEENGSKSGYSKGDEIFHQQSGSGSSGYTYEVSESEICKN